jgi:hypothetical protein
MRLAGTRARRDLQATSGSRLATGLPWACRPRALLSPVHQRAHELARGTRTRPWHKLGPARRAAANPPQPTGNAQGTNQVQFRCRAAGIPDGTAFATGPRLGRRMITRILDAGAPAGWAAGARSIAPARACARTWKRARWVTCWPWRKHHQVSTGAGPAALISSPPACPMQLGSGIPPAKGARPVDRHGHPCHTRTAIM